MNRYLLGLERRSKPFWLVVGALLAVALAWLRTALQSDVAVPLLFLMPVAMVAWFAGTVSGYATSALATLILVIGDRFFTHHRLGFGPEMVDEASRLVIFLLASYILGRLRSLLDGERQNARTDDLTGIPNRRGFFELATAELRRARRYPHPLSVVYLDADEFKTVNDTMGHSTGDALLRDVAEVIRKNIRGIDIAGRLGGDEFAILLPETPEEAGRTVVARLREAIAEEMHTRAWPVTFSIGMVTFLNLEITPEEMVHEADGLMYAAKNSGRGEIRDAVFAR